MSALLCARVPSLLSARALAPHRAQVQHLRPRLAPQQRAGRRSMGAAFSSAAQPDLTQMIEQKNAENPVMVYSKTYCPYCSEVKSLFKQLNVPFKVVELDDLADGSEVQAALARVTGRSTVPQVFVGGKHVGGCDDTMAAQSSGKLRELMLAAGIQV